MKKEYAVFVKEFNQALTDETGYSKNRIYFKEKDEYPRTVGDRVFVEFSIGEETKEVCGLYIRDLYEDYLNGSRMYSLVKEAVREINRIKKSGILEKAKDLNDYEKIRSSLFVRLLNKEKARSDLGNAIYREIGDIVLVLYVRLGNFDGIFSSFKVRKDMLESWEEEEKEVFRKAIQNTYDLSPPRIYRWEKMIFDPDYSGDEFMDNDFRRSIRKNALGNCLSTTERTNGAVAIFLPGVAERIGYLLDSSFYLAFTSVHEVMIHRECEVSVEELRRVVKETIKEATPEEDFLTTLIFHYDRETGVFTWE